MSSIHLLLGLIVAAATTNVTLTPRLSSALPAAMGRYAADVAWENTDSVLIASDKGVHRYSLRTRANDRLISTSPLPDGVPDPEAVASDGTTAVATSHLSIGGYAMRLADRKRIAAMRVYMLPLDVAVRGQRACILAYQMTDQPRSVAWCGPADKSWLTYKPVHRLVSATANFSEAYAFGRGGGIAMGEDGSVTVATTVEPGVFHYSADGKLLDTSGLSFDELVLRVPTEVRRQFATDVEGRYRLLLNTQPIIEDLVLTAKGPALVVRVAEKEHVRWELWWPRSDGRSSPPTRLGIDRLGPYGHLQCDARGNSLACVGSLPDKKQAADFRVAEFTPYLWIFDLPK